MIIAQRHQLDYSFWPKVPLTQNELDRLVLTQCGRSRIIADRLATIEKVNMLPYIGNTW